MSVAPMVAVVAHPRTLDTVLGEQVAALAYGGYLQQLDRAGAAVVVLAPGTRVPDVVRDGLDGLLLTGGGDVAPEQSGGAGEARDVDRERDELEIDLVRHCRARRVPVLAVCRGSQVLNVALGGTLRTVDDHVQSESLSTPVQNVGVEPGCRLWDVFGDKVAVNSFHRWAVDAPADGVRVAARAPDGVIEGVEWNADDWFALGVQWHAELLDQDAMAGLFDVFVDAARERSAP